ncbi:PREDICTED: WD repeat-containing protein DDB_G0292056-like [Diuraphis noxia]|uniref:WD repeat-containing protein DDB_G0292056-like n=1 Tax=Diuraphis noxia TaxID=143948 RepID=UPI00076368D3|nr:PREDICTED: WD repeat-containing protein DDB_G0292056-like [Diuraphis noxia]
MSGINLSTNSSPDSSDINSFHSIDIESPTVVAQKYYGNSIIVAPILPQPRYTNQNNQKSLTWNISLTYDQDEVSENFLRMYNEPTTVAEKFGSAILVVPENIRKQADELFKPSEINPNEIFDWLNTKVSWILPSSYQQYLKSIPPNVLEKRERHVLYPWTQWNTSTGTQHRPSLNITVASPLASDQSMSSSSSLSSSSVYAHASHCRSPDNNNNNNSSSNNNNNNSFGYRSDGGGNGTLATPTAVDCTLSSSSASDLSFSYWAGVDATSSPQQHHYLQHYNQQQQQSVGWTPATVRSSPSDCGRSVSSAEFVHYNSTADGRSPSPTSVRWPSRLFYCVNADNNTINKLVEHYCTFCYKNHEPPEVYGGHLVRDETRTTCPKLRALRCKHCNGTGDNAHTIKYCPFLYSNYS